MADSSKLLVSIEGVAAMLDVSERKAHEMRKEPGFPAPVMLGIRCRRWRVSDLEAYIAGLPLAPELNPEPSQLREKREATKRPTALRALGSHALGAAA